MTTLGFENGLVENTFSFGNMYTYSEKNSYGLYFSKESQNYPFILKGGLSDDFELEYVRYTHQLRGRLLNTKKLKEVMDGAKIPLYFLIKQVPYLIGKGFLSTFDPAGNHQLLFIACVDGTKNITSIQQVKFYVSKMAFDDHHKAIRTAVEDLIKGHSGDVIQCNNILDYVGEKLTFPRGASLSELNKYKQAVIRTCLMEEFERDPVNNEPLVVESNHGPISIGVDDSDSSMDTSQVLRTLRTMPSSDTTFSASEDTANVSAAMAVMNMLSDITRGVDVAEDRPSESTGAELPF